MLANSARAVFSGVAWTLSTQVHRPGSPSVARDQLEAGEASGVTSLGMLWDMRGHAEGINDSTVLHDERETVSKGR
jgi:hypothetical protein